MAEEAEKTRNARAEDEQEPVGNPLPRWRGFNLLEMFNTRSTGEWQEDDFAWTSDWGFDFVRLPMCYLLWTDPDDVLKVKEEWLEKIDRAVDLGAKHGIHVCLNFHRAPGFSVNKECEEPFNLWKDKEAQAAFCHHWRVFAERYKGAGNLSFNLVNEPKRPTYEEMTRGDHERVIRACIAEVKEVDPERLVIVDGISWGRDPLPELADLDVAQSCRAYDPHCISHYKASWAHGEQYDEPIWPDARQGYQVWDRRSLESLYDQWSDLARQGVGVHCGEGGCFNKTPHDVYLRWFRDVLEVLTERSIGWALWNLRGAFGVLDSNREDVEYEEFHGHALDRKLLDLLQEF